MNGLNKAGDSRGKTKSDEIVHCKKCGLELAYGKVRKHHIEVHGMTMKKRGSNEPAEPKNVSAFDIVSNMKAQAKQAMIKIDDERNDCHRRILELDALAVKLKPYV